jgi:transposase
LVKRVVELTHEEPPGEATHWTVRAMAKAVGISMRSVQRIGAAHGLRPHLIKTFKLSNDPRFVDNYAPHQHGKVKTWLQRHPRFHLHFTPTSASWLNAVEGFFAKLTKRRLKRGVFHSIVDLQAAINRFLAEHNQNPKPFVWTADPDRIIEKANRGKQALESIH